MDCLKQRNTYQGNGSLTWPKPMANSVSSVGVFNSSNCSLQNEEYGSHVNEIVLSSRTKAHTMVSAAIQVQNSSLLTTFLFHDFHSALMCLVVVCSIIKLKDTNCNI